MFKNFNQWNQLKIELHQDNKNHLFFKIWNIVFGDVNVGSEQDGKGEYFRRPVLILKKFNQNIFLGIPLTSVNKNNNKHYFKFSFKKNKTSYAILSQVRLFDKKRLLQKVGGVSFDIFEQIKNKLKELIYPRHIISRMITKDIYPSILKKNSNKVK